MPPVRATRPETAGRPARAGTACAALALALLAWTAPAASGELCDRSLHAEGTRYEPVEVSYEISKGEFLGFCANQEYGVFDIFLDAEAGGELLLTIQKERFDPRQFDYGVCRFGYGVNGGGSEHAGILAEQVGETDRDRTLSFAWDIPVSQISYAKSPAACIKKHDIVDHLVYPPPIKQLLPKWIGENSYLASLDADCASTGNNIIRLNHTIAGGNLDQVCALGSLWMVFDISAESAGELVVDIPKDVFPRHASGYREDGRLGPGQADYGYPFAVTVWGRSGIPSSIGVFDHDEGVSRPSNCAYGLHCFPFSFWWGGQISKISSHDAFDRYSIPFGADDAKIVFWTHETVMHAVYFGYHPEKYVAEPQVHFCREPR